MCTQKKRLRDLERENPIVMRSTWSAYGDVCCISFNTPVDDADEAAQSANLLNDNYNEGRKNVNCFHFYIN